MIKDALNKKGYWSHIWECKGELDYQQAFREALILKQKFKDKYEVQLREIKGKDEIVAVYIEIFDPYYYKRKNKKDEWWIY